MMKRFFGGVVIVLAVVLSSGAVYGQEKIKETIIGSIPAVWGSLRSIGTTTYSAGAMALYFEDSQGTIRKAFVSGGKYSSEGGRVENPKVMLGDTLVIKRSK